MPLYIQYIDKSPITMNYLVHILLVLQSRKASDIVSGIEVQHKWICPTFIAKTKGRVPKKALEVGSRNLDREFWVPIIFLEAWCI